MAERRMFAKTITESDAFLDMPMSSQCLYFHLGMVADDDGFVNSPKKIQRMIGASEDDLKLLIAKRFLLPFDSGVVVIKHWKMNNFIRNDRYKATVYQEEKALLTTNENGSYSLGIPNDNQRYTQVRLGKVSIGKDNDDLSILNRLKETEKWKLMDACGSAELFDQFIRYADAKISTRTDSSPISDPYQYLMAMGINDGFIED